ncbi:MAG: hypothetical protein WD052_08950 [Bacteroidales bacterium]
MFSIGLFSTYLPYIVLAMFYGVYVGIHTIIQEEQLFDSDTSGSAAKVISKVSDNSEQQSIKNTYYYDQYSKTVCQEPDIPSHATVFVIHPAGNIPLARSWFFSTLFSRPPPIT